MKTRLSLIEKLIEAKSLRISLDRVIIHAAIHARSSYQMTWPRIHLTSYSANGKRHQCSSNLIPNEYYIPLYKQHPRYSQTTFTLCATIIQPDPSKVSFQHTESHQLKKPPQRITKIVLSQWLANRRRLATKQTNYTVTNTITNSKVTNVTKKMLIHSLLIAELQLRLVRMESRTRSKRIRDTEGQRDHVGSRSIVRTLERREQEAEADRLIHVTGTRYSGVVGHLVFAATSNWPGWSAFAEISPPAAGGRGRDLRGKLARDPTLLTSLSLARSRALAPSLSLMLSRGILSPCPVSTCRVPRLGSAPGTRVLLVGMMRSGRVALGFGFFSFRTETRYGSSLWRGCEYLWFLLRQDLCVEAGLLRVDLVYLSERIL